MNNILLYSRSFHFTENNSIWPQRWVAVGFLTSRLPNFAMKPQYWRAPLKNWKLYYVNFEMSCRNNYLVLYLLFRCVIVCFQFSRIFLTKCDFDIFYWKYSALPPKLFDVYCTNENKTLSSYENRVCSYILHISNCIPRVFISPRVPFRPTIHYFYFFIYLFVLTFKSIIYRVVDRCQ